MTDSSRVGKKKHVKEVRKPFMTGTPKDENTLKSALKFFGLMIVIIFVAFITCASTATGSLVIRLVINIAVIAVTIMIFYHNGAGRGADDISRGEILYQKKEKGQEINEAERKLCYHRFKGFLTGLIGMIPFILLGIVFALNTTIQTADPGTLPSWMQSYTKRSDIGDALVAYTQPEGLNVIGIIRMIIRICIIPYVNLVGYENNMGMLFLERICPVLFLLPAVSYGIGYLTGKKIRTGIHTAISENEKKRIRKEKKRIRARTGQNRRHEPEQLN